MVADAALELLTSAELPLILHDSALVVTGWSEGATRCFGFSEQEIVGRRLDETILPGTHVESWREALSSGGAPRTFDCIRKGGEKVMIEWRCVALDGEEAVATSYLCLARPTTSSAARAPSLEERVLRALLDNIPLSLWVVDQKGDYVFHDGRGIELVGVKRGSYLGSNMWEMWKGVEGTRETLRQVKVAMESKHITHAFAEAMDRSWESWCIPLETGGGRGRSRRLRHDRHHR